MAMIKERPKDKCGSVDKKGKNSNNSGTSTVVAHSNGALKSDSLENDIDAKEESFAITDDIMEKVSGSSPTSVACTFADPKTFAMDMCPVDSKLDRSSFVNSNLSACKSQVKTEDIINADADFSPDFMLDGSLSSCKAHKTEDINQDPVFPPDSCDGMPPSISMTMGSTESLVDGVQPLSSNVVSKQPSTMDGQYMQQQNQVFVFSTQLANQSAEAVRKGKFKSIIDYHCAQPETKKFFTRHPFKPNQQNQHQQNQFQRQNMVQWPPSTAQQMKSKNIGVVSPRCGPGRGNFRSNPMMSPEMMNHNPGGPPPAGMNMPSRIPTWNQQGNMNPMNNSNQHGPMMSPMCNNNMLPGSGPGPMNSGLPGPMGPNQVGMMHGAMPPMKCQSQPSSMDMMADSPNPNQMLSNSVLPPPIGNYPEDQFPLSPQASLAGNLMHPSEACGQFLYARPEAVAHQPAQQAHIHLPTSKSVKIPDENLTPTQRLRREDKLAALRKIGEMLERGNHHQSSHHPINSELPPSTHNPPISVDEISSVLSGDNSGGEPTDVPLQKTTNAPGGPPTTPGDWQNMPSFFDERSGKRVPDVGNMNRCGSRSQGPPPPYHQTTRSASVPIAIPSPNPNSPGNATSNLSLPSPRTCSGLNSPASKQGPGPSPTTNQMNTSIESPGQSHGRGLNISNPGTPVSSSMHLSPNSKQKEGKMCTGPMSNEFSPAASGQQSPDGIFCRSLQSLARQSQQKQQPQLPHTQSLQSANSHCKEPNLMPVPSPQHIQYLSSFEGQELTIQKQANTSLKDTSIVSPSLSQAGLDTMIPTTTDSSCSKVIVSAPNTPLTPSSLDLGSSKYPGTPGDFSALSPGADPKSQLRGNNSNQLKNDLRFTCSSPQLPDQQRYQPTTTSFMSQTNKNSFLDVSSPEKVPCSLGSDSKDQGSSCAGGNFPRGMIPNNVPIDPTAAPKPSFDPISSLAQMSQQLTNNVPGSPSSQVGMMHSGMMPYNSGGPGHVPNNMNMMQMNEMGMCGNPANEPPMQDGSRMVFNQQMPPGMNMGMGNNVGNRMMPCPSGEGGPGPKSNSIPGPYPMMSGNPPRMMRPQGPHQNSYNGANIQVRSSAPNTIQYLPSRPQQTAAGARGPPSLDFLRYQNPNVMANMENKMPPHNMNYFPNNYAGGPPPGANMNEMMGSMNCSMPPGNPMVRPGMRGPNPPPNMMRLGGGNMGMPPYNDQMYPPGGPNPNMPNNNCHMFMSNPGGPGPKMSPMGMGGNVAPDATQPLPPSMGQANNFKNSPFMGPVIPEMNDPQYRQQFHNFQQQLYATNTRSQMNNQPMPGSNQQYFVPK